jgi:hypothetical protein
LLAFATAKGREHAGDLFAEDWRLRMKHAIDEVSGALRILGRDPQGNDIKASDDFLAPVFEKFYSSLGLPNLLRKTDYHTLAPYVPVHLIDEEVKTTLSAIVAVAQRAKAKAVST